MIYQEFIEKTENAMKPYAVKDEKSKSRKTYVPTDGHRTEFQKDRDRVLYSSSFRRLAYKTQVFVYNRNNMHRNRMTHSLEVSQMSRAIAQMLELNVDLCDAISLSHDLGHGPFGHSGEHTLARLMKDFGGFEHNSHSLRVVDRLEKVFANYYGLNLTYATREGIIKHKTGYDSPRKLEEFNERSSTLETEIVCYADRVAFNSHDLEDAFREGILNMQILVENSSFFRDVSEELKGKYSNISQYDFFLRCNSKFIERLVSDLIDTTRSNIEKHQIKSFEDVISLERNFPVVEFNRDLAAQVKEIEKLLAERVYYSRLVERMNDKASFIIEQIFKRYMKNLNLISEVFLSMYSDQEKKNMRETIICDYIAGMTDEFANREYKSLFDPDYDI